MAIVTQALNSRNVINEQMRAPSNDIVGQVNKPYIIKTIAITTSEQMIIVRGFMLKDF